ncbi:MAG: excinuclease ABC subunit C [Legionella sp. 40-6]|nr:GIY-YIG nuclease family protein [Legionella sp.]OJX97652.1 MAG: excinuclease ABC subunit C [Legionella sp. 40-6]
MSELRHKKILILDCQTTGMHPSTGHLLQLGWCVMEFALPQRIAREQWTLKRDEARIPTKIKKLLRISDTDLAQSVEPARVFQRLQDVLQELGEEPVVIAHYAQFEHRFLTQFYLEHGHSSLNFTLLCSQKIAKRLLPHLPSHNLNAVAGHFQWSSSATNKLDTHLSMTAFVWQKLLPLLLAEKITLFTQLATWLATKPEPKSRRLAYNIERLARLSLPQKPGIYRMLTQDGTVLYIGKATSLHARVNSYFRGQKNRDRRILEMLTQVWSIETCVCDTPLEAALLESDEIKKWSPPYNVLLQSDRHALIFYQDDFSEYSERPDSQFRNGPFKIQDALAVLRELFHALTHHTVFEYRKERITSEMLNQAWLVFSAHCRVVHHHVEQPTMRTLIQIGYHLLKHHERKHGKYSFEQWWREEKKTACDEALMPEERCARILTRILIRAAEARRKSKMIARLRNATLMIEPYKKQLFVVHGELSPRNAPRPTQNTGTCAFELAHYDRLAILYSALIRKQVTLL